MKLNLVFYKPPPPAKKGPKASVDYDLIISKIREEVDENNAMEISKLDEDKIRADSVAKYVRVKLTKLGIQHNYKISTLDSVNKVIISRKEV